jgi:thioredoxin 1
VLLDPSAFNAAAQSATALPRLVELGSTTCVPCKMMKPILDELTAEYAGTLAVEFIDVHARQEQAAAFNVRVIPTQVFLDASGKELFRHEGFFPKEDILAQWKELGITLSGPTLELKAEK